MTLLCMWVCSLVSFLSPPLVSSDMVIHFYLFVSPFILASDLFSFKLYHHFIPDLPLYFPLPCPFLIHISFHLHYVFNTISLLSYYLCRLQMAERFGLPVITLVDTVGAWPTFECERDGQSEVHALTVIYTLSHIHAHTQTHSRILTECLTVSLDKSIKSACFPSYYTAHLFCYPPCLVTRLSSASFSSPVMLFVPPDCKLLRWLWLKRQLRPIWRLWQVSRCRSWPLWSEREVMHYNWLALSGAHM